MRDGVQASLFEKHEWDDVWIHSVGYFISVLEPMRWTD